MTTRPDLERSINAWLIAEAPDRAPDDLLEASRDRIRQTHQRRSLWPARRYARMNRSLQAAIAAVAVVAVAILGYNLLPGGGTGGPGGSPNPLASPTPLPTATAVSSPVPTLMAVPSAGPLTPGTYVLTTVPSLRITFTVPASGWQKNVVPSVIWTSNSDGRIGFGTVDNLYTDPCDPALGVRDPAVGPTVGELADALANLPGLEPATPSNVTMSGSAGRLVAFNVPATTSSCGATGLSLYPTEFGSAPLDGLARHRFWILDVEGTRLVIQAVERQNLGPAFREQLQQIVDSIRIQPA